MFSSRRFTAPRFSRRPTCHRNVLVILASVSCLVIGWAHAETLVLSSGRTIVGTIIQTNGNDLVLLTDFSIFKFGRDNIKSIEGAQAEIPEIHSTSRLPSFKTAVLSLSRNKWGADLMQIPATVIEKGVFRNVPYVSFRCGDDYEVNIYGDLTDPAAIEAGFYRTLLGNETARSNCLGFIKDVLGEAGDKDLVQGLAREKDLKVRSGMSFEVTAPTDEDAYHGWWISVYSEQKLNRSRASESELSEISISKSTGANGAPRGDSTGWSAQDLKMARPTQPLTVSFLNSAGEPIKDAEVVRVEDNAYLIWRKGASGGKVKLADLSEDLRSLLGYDAAKAAGSYAVEDKRKALLSQERNEAAQAGTVESTSGYWLATIRIFQ